MLMIDCIKLIVYNHVSLTGADKHTTIWTQAFTNQFEITKRIWYMCKCILTGYNIKLLNAQLLS